MLCDIYHRKQSGRKYRVLEDSSLGAEPRTTISSGEKPLRTVPKQNMPQEAWKVREPPVLSEPPTYPFDTKIEQRKIAPKVWWRICNSLRYSIPRHVQRGSQHVDVPIRTDHRQKNGTPLPSPSEGCPRVDQGLSAPPDGTSKP